MTTNAPRRIVLAALLAIAIAPFFANGVYNPRLVAKGYGWFWAVELTTWFAMPLAFLCVALHRRLFTLRDLGLTTRVRGSSHPLLLSALLLAVPIGMCWLDVRVTDWSSRALPTGWPLPPPFKYYDLVPPPGPETGWYRLAAVTYFCVSAGVVEELYYRAALSRLFPRCVGAAIAYVALSSLLFAGAHWENGLPNVAVAFAVGLYAACIFRLTGNLWPLIVGHVATDWYWFAGS